MDRVLSGGMSIGTGMALETIFDVTDRCDPEREVDKIDIEDYDYHIYSIHTLVRNVINSLPRPNKGIEEKDLLNMLIDDINLLVGYYSDVSTEVLIVENDYEKISKPFNKGKDIKLNKTQVEFIELNQWVKDNSLIKSKLLDVNVIKGESVPRDKELLVTTSFLLDVDIYGSFDLLESHTGSVKKKHELSKKYHSIGKSDLSILPYTKTLHQILGDKTYVIPLKISIRKEVYEIAVDKKWNVRTTESRVRETLKRNKDLKDLI